MEQIQEHGKIDNSIEAWKKMLKVHGVDKTTTFLSKFENDPGEVIKIVTNLGFKKNVVQQMLRNIFDKDTDNYKATQDFKSIKELLTCTDALNKMLEIYGVDETLNFLYNFEDNIHSEMFFAANLQLPKSINRVRLAEKFIEDDKPEVISDFTSSQNLVKTMNFLNTMSDVHGPSETLSFLSTCNYNDQSIKFLIAALSLPESMDRVRLAENIIKKNQKELSWDFKTNEELVRAINKWNMEIKINGPQRVLESLSKKSYRAKCIKFIMANLQLPKTMNRSTETEKIIEANKKNILLKFRENIPNLAEKKLDSQTLTRFIDTFDLSKNEAKTLKQEAILATQKISARDVKSLTPPPMPAPRAKKVVTDTKKLQSKTNESGACTDKIHFKYLKEIKAKILKQEAILATQKVSAHDVKSLTPPPMPAPRAKKVVTDTKKLQSKTNESGACTDKVHFKYLKEIKAKILKQEAILATQKVSSHDVKSLTRPPMPAPRAKNGSSHQPFSSKSKNKNISEHTK